MHIILYNNCTIFFSGYDHMETSGTCHAYTHIHYIKIPKTGSTTMSNILHRLITKHKLNISPGSGSKCTQIFDNHLSKIDKFDMSTEHKKFNETEIFKCLHSDTKIITLIREPHSQMKSRILYHGIVITNSSVAKITATKRYKELFQRPTTMQYFGINEDKVKVNDTYLKKELEYRKNIFELVLINERYDESLVLLKRRMCWTMKDILHLELKKQIYPDMSYLDSKEIRKQHKKQAAIEYRLYDVFYKVFDEMVSLEDSFQDEVMLYRHIKSKVNRFCDKVICQILRQNTSLAVKKTLSSSFAFKGSEIYRKFVVSGSDCLLMSLKQTCYHPMLMRQTSERIYDVQGDNNGKKSVYASVHNKTFVAENLPFNLVLPCTDASFSCFQFMGRKPSKFISVKV